LSIVLYMIILMPLHVGQHHFQLLPSCEYVFVPEKSPIEAQPEILDIFLLRNVYVIYMDWGAGFSSCGECDVDRLGFIGFYSPSL
jgi:hypothetical protein